MKSMGYRQSLSSQVIECHWSKAMEGPRDTLNIYLLSTDNVQGTVRGTGGTEGI